MGLLSFFQRVGKPASEAAAAPASDVVAAARARARRRLIGATVLLAAGVIGFPLLFETQPRPVSVDIPIVIPDKDQAAPLVLSQAPAAMAQPAQAPSPSPVAAEVRERAGDQGREVPPPDGAVADSGTPTLAAAPVPDKLSPPADVKPDVSKPELAKPAPAKPEIAAKTPRTASAAAVTPDLAAQRNDAARARALLEGRPVANADEARMVVQVGAFAEAEAVRAVRSQVEKLGFKTYTQVVDVAGARRTRVRVGPFSNRAEADKAAARIKAAGLPAAILSL